MAKPFAVHERDVPVEGGKDDPTLRVEWRTLLSGDRTPTEGLTLGVAFTYLIFVATGSPCPKVLGDVYLGLLSFYFGSR